MAGKVYIGTSGWQYSFWKQDWYGGAPSKDWLRIIDERLGSVEVNGSFYRQQKPETFAKWADQVSEQFRFAIRGHRYITHQKRIAGVTESVELVKSQAAGLGSKLAAVLWQLPPSMKKNIERLHTFAKDLSTWPEVYHVMEFRHTSWFDEETLNALNEHGLINCISDAGRFKRWDATTERAVYVRLHGNPRTYRDSYSDAEVAEWAAKTRQWSESGRDVFFYFDNDIEVAAPWNALTLKQMVESPAAKISLR